MKAPPLSPAAVFSWTGFYIGGHFGGGWLKSTPTAVTPTGTYPTGTVFNSGRLSGVLGGVQAGYNYQFDHWVIGVEGDFSFADLNGTESTPGVTAPFTETSHYHSRDTATIAGRFGYAVDHALVYAKGGVGWVKYSFDGITTANATGAISDTFTGGATRAGWLVGGGVEWAFAPHWSAKIEYDYLNFGTFNYVVNDNVLGPLLRSVTANSNVVKVGINYLFN